MEPQRREERREKRKRKEITNYTKRQVAADIELHEPDENAKQEALEAAKKGTRKAVLSVTRPENRYPVPGIPPAFPLEGIKNLIIQDLIPSCDSALTVFFWAFQYRIITMAAFKIIQGAFTQ